MSLAPPIDHRITTTGNAVVTMIDSIKEVRQINTNTANRQTVGKVDIRAKLTKNLTCRIYRTDHQKLESKLD